MLLTRALRQDRHRWVLGLVLVTLCSWGRFLGTGSLKIDENYPSETVGTILFIGLLLGWGLLILAWKGLLEQRLESPRQLAFTGLFVVGFMLPMLSNDVWAVLAHASVAAQGHDVYASADALPGSVWFSWVGDRWKGVPCVYGPISLAASMPSVLAGANPWLALLFLRIAWFLPLVLVMELSFRLLADRPFFHAMLWLNPLFLVEGPGQLHVDLIGVLLVTAGILMQRKGNVLTGRILWALAVLSKLTFLVTGFWFLLVGAPATAPRSRRPWLVPTVLTALGILVCLPFVHGLAALIAPLRAVAQMNPGGTITDVAGELVDRIRVAGHDIFDPTMPVAAVVAAQRATRVATWQVVSRLMLLVALAAALPVLRAMLRRPRDEDRIALGTGALVVIAVTLASPRFQSWYLMVALPFFGLSCTRAWRRWWIGVEALCVTQGFVLVLPRTAVLFEPWVALSTGVTALFFLWSFRERYWRLETAGMSILPGEGSRDSQARGMLSG